MPRYSPTGGRGAHRGVGLLQRVFFGCDLTQRAPRFGSPRACPGKACPWALTQRAGAGFPKRPCDNKSIELTTRHAFNLEDCLTMVFASLGCFGHSARASQHLEPQPPKPMSRPMSRLSRRSFLTVSAALASRPAFAAGPAAAPPLDVVIVGAGAAGIAAARRIAAAGRKFIVIEAADHIGGRCVTDTRSFDVPFDRGAHWIHTPDFNPLMKLIPRRGLEVYPAPASQKVRIGRRYAREGELEDFLALQVRANRGIIEAARKGDIACAQALPNDLGDWRPAIEFVLGPFSCAKDLSQVSTADYAKSAERNTDAFCRQGLGTMLATFAEG